MSLSASEGGCCIRGFHKLEEIRIGEEYEGELFADGFAVWLHDLDELLEIGGFGILAVNTGGFALAFGAGLQGQGDLLAWLFPPFGGMASCRKEVT